MCMAKVQTHRRTAYNSVKITARSKKSQLNNRCLREIIVICPLDRKSCYKRKSAIMTNKRKTEIKGLIKVFKFKSGNNISS